MPAQGSERGTIDDGNKIWFQLAVEITEEV